MALLFTHGVRRQGKGNPERLGYSEGTSTKHSIFHRHRPEDDLLITIELDNNRELQFQPGSEVVGRVSVQSPTPISVEHLNLNFFGHAKTQITRRKTSGTGDNRRTTTEHYYDDANLFHQPVSLAQHFIVHDQVMKFDFLFTFPRMTYNARNDYVNEMANNPIWTDRPHELPPTFHNAKGWDECDVVYGLDAFVHFPGNEHPTVKGLQLNFSPFSKPQINLPLIEVAKQHHFSSRALVGQQPSFADRIADKFSKHTPRIDFILKAAIVPEVFVFSASFPIHATLQISRMSSDDVHVPSIKMRVKKIKLCPFTQFRSIRDKDSWKTSFQDEEWENWEDKSISLNAAPETTELSPQVSGPSSSSERMLNFPFTFQARIPSEAVPDFQSFNITHSHTLKYTIEAEVFGKTFEVSNETRIGVLSAFPKPSAPASRPRSHQSINTQPPQYSQASGSAEGAPPMPGPSGDSNKF